MQFMTEKVCSKCKETKLLTSFNKKGGGKYYSSCKECVSLTFKKNHGTLREVPESDKIVIEDLEGEYWIDVIGYEARLSEKDILDIVNSTKDNQELADHYKVCKRYISSLKRGKGWKHINKTEYVPVFKYVPEEVKKQMAHTKGSQRTIAKMFGVSATTVLKARRVYLQDKKTA